MKKLLALLIGLVTMALIATVVAAILILPGLGIMHFLKPKNNVDLGLRLMMAVTFTLMSVAVTFGAYKVTRGLYDMAIGVGEAVIEYWQLWRENRK